MISIVVIPPPDLNNAHGFATEAQARMIAMSLRDTGTAKPIDGVITCSEAEPGSYNTSYRPDAGFLPFNVWWQESVLAEGGDNSGQMVIKRVSLNAGNVAKSMISNPGGGWRRTGTDLMWG